MNRKTVLRVVITFLVLMIFIPLLINFLFKHDFGIELFRAEWSAGDALVYCGTIVSVFFAVGGVWLSIKENNKMNQENIRISTLPYILFKSMDPSLVSCKTSKESTFKLYAGELSWESLSDYNLKMIKDEYLEEYRGKEFLGMKDRSIGWFILRNSGRGTTLYLTMALVGDGKKDDGTGRFYLCDELIQGDAISVLFYTDKICEDNDVNIGEYNLIVEYCDIWSNQYRITIPFGIVKEGPKLYSMWGAGWAPQLVGNIDDLTQGTI